MNNYKTIKVEDLTNPDLFRLLLNELWIRYDLGGISAGRSYQASLIESFMDLFEMTVPRNSVKGTCIDEVNRRMENFSLGDDEKNQLQLCFSELNCLSDAEFALIALKELCRWYAEDAERLGFYNQYHRILANAVKSICEIAFPSIRYNLISYMVSSGKEIVDHGKERTRGRQKEKSRLEDFERFGYNPWINPLNI